MYIICVCVNNLKISPVRLKKITSIDFENLDF